MAKYNFNIIILAIVGLAVIISGCIGGQDVTSVPIFNYSNETRNGSQIPIFNYSNETRNGSQISVENLSNKTRVSSQISRINQKSIIINTTHY